MFIILYIPLLKWLMRASNIVKGCSEIPPHLLGVELSRLHGNVWNQRKEDKNALTLVGLEFTTPDQESSIRPPMHPTCFYGVVKVTRCLHKNSPFMLSLLAKHGMENFHGRLCMRARAHPV